MSKVGAWIQTLSGVAVLAGLILVILELEQTKDLTRAELAAESSNLALTREVALIGENAMSTLAKACDPNEEISIEDALVLDLIFRAYLQTVVRSYEVGVIGGYDDERWKRVANGNFPRIFATQHGRDWWSAVQNEDSEMAEYANSILKSQGPPSCLPIAEVILEADRNKNPN